MLTPAETAYAQWVEFNNETSARFNVAPSLGASDQEEKDYAWGDVNNNGWTDLVIMRKQPFSTPGKRVNVLMMNENGVLVDRTAQFASASDVAGDQGFLTPTNDRHSILFDLTNNGWLDLTTAPAYGGGDPKHVSHPRVYRNLGSSGGGWQGFIFENARTPQLASAPNTCAVAAGDLTQDGFADLYFVTYSQTAPDFLLVNNGNGFFTHNNLGIPNAFANSSFGTSGVIADLTLNGLNDIMKNENGPTKIVYNLGGGNFSNNTSPDGGANYHANLADLNNNGRLDLLIANDGQDRIILNLGTNAQGQVIWSDNIMLPESSCGSGNFCTGFGGNLYGVDLNNNGWNDILVADVDVDISGCGRFSNIYRNNMNGPNVTFARDLGNIPVSMLQGVFDFAIMDITGNGWMDIVVGRCSGTQVWIQQPPFSMTFNYPQGHPNPLEPEKPTPLEVELLPQGGSVDPGSVRLHVSIDGGAFAPHDMTLKSANLFEADLPPVDCLQEVRYFITASINSVEFTSPNNAPANSFFTVALLDTEVVREENFDAATVPADWGVNHVLPLTQGGWKHGHPTGVLHGITLAAPEGDSSPSGSGRAFATCLGSAGPATSCNVQGGPTHLISEAIDLSEAASAYIVYDRWFYSQHQGNPLRETFLETYVSDDNGASWVFVHKTSGTASDWQTASFLVSEFVDLTSTVRVRFTVEDTNTVTSVTNAGIDNFIVEEVICSDDPLPSCPGDLDGDNKVDGFDLLALLGCWGAVQPGSPCAAADLNNDNQVNGFDLLDLLGNWGPCP